MRRPLRETGRAFACEGQPAGRRDENPSNPPFPAIALRRGRSYIHIEIRYEVETEMEIVMMGGAEFGIIALLLMFLPTLIALPTFLNAYVCQQNFLPILAELDRPTPNRKLSLSALTIGVSASVYLVFAWAGA